MREARVEPTFFSKLNVIISNLREKVVELMKMLRRNIGNSPLRCTSFTQESVKVGGEVEHILSDHRASQ